MDVKKLKIQYYSCARVRMAVHKGTEQKDGEREREREYRSIERERRDLRYK
jgi:hypothetical protein